MFKPIFIKVGAGGSFDPNPGDTDCVLPFPGADLYLVGVDPSLYEVIPTGGFRLLTDVFAFGAEYFIQLTGLAYNTTGTSYTNGFNFQRIISAMFGRVGWNQVDANAGVPLLNSNNLLSRSGRKFNDGSFHALVTLKNIFDVMELESADEAQFNAYITGLQQAAILKCVNGVFASPEYISTDLLFMRWGSNDTVIENTGKFVGVRIVPPPRTDLSTQIESVSVLFDQDVQFPLYLFSDSNPQPVWTGQITATANTKTTVEISDLVINYTGGGAFFFGYYQADIGSARAIKESNVHFAKDLPFGYQMFTTGTTGFPNYDAKEYTYSNDTNGINMQLSVFRDHTEQIIKKASAFDNVMGMQMEAMIIELILNSTRSNRNERITKEDATIASAELYLNGSIPITEGPTVEGLKHKIGRELRKTYESFYPREKSTIVERCY